MALVKCHECGQPVSTTATACPKCGAKPQMPQMPQHRNDSRVGLFVIIGVVILLLIVSGINNQIAQRAEKQRIEEQFQRNVALSKQEAESFGGQRDVVLSSARAAITTGDFSKAAAAIEPYALVKDTDLEQIRGLIANHEKQVKDAKEKESLLKEAAALKADAVDDGIRIYGRLNVIDPQNKDYKAKLDHLTKIKPEIDARRMAKAELEARKAFAQATEDRFLSQGWSATVTAQGANATTLHVKFVLVSKAFAYQIQHADDFVSACRRLGFKKIEMYDGYSETWTLSL